MAAVALDRIDVDSITERAKSIRFGKTLLNLIAGLIFGAAWVIAKLFRLAWLTLAWCYAAGEMGWRQAHGKTDALLPSKQELAAENAALREELRRRGG